MKREDLDPVDQAVWDQTRGRFGDLAGARTPPAAPIVTRVETVLNTVRPEEVDWLWTGRLPVGKLVVLDGDPSVGKSTLALDCAARVSAGRSMPGAEELEPVHGAVVLMSAEDGLADTIRPRLDAARADCGNVIALTAVRVQSGDRVEVRPPAIPDDADQLEACVVEHGARLAVVDVLTAYLSSETNSYRDQDVRRALAPLAAMADRTGCCVIVLRHLRKQSGGSAIYAGGGSIAIVGAARVGLIAAYDPDDAAVPDPNERRRVLSVVKNNLGRLSPSLGYRIVGDGAASRIEWLGTVVHRADDLVDFDNRDDERDEKVEFLTELLTGDPVPARDVEKAANAAGGWSLKALRPTLKRLGGRSIKTGDGPWEWTLNGDLPLEGDQGR